jgi:hypothetical protein
MRALIAGFLLLLTTGLAHAIPADGQWEYLPGTSIKDAQLTPSEVPAGAWTTQNLPGNHVEGWTSFPWDDLEGVMSSIRNGGHVSEGGPGDSYAIDLDDAITGAPTAPAVTWWQRVEPFQPLRDYSVPAPYPYLPGARLDNNSRCPWPPHGSPSVHSYDMELWIGGTEYFLGGNPGFCKEAVMTPGNSAFFVDKGTSPWTYTELPLLRPYVPGAAAYKDGRIYLCKTGCAVVRSHDEDVNGNSAIDSATEDLDGDLVLDAGEDLNSNGVLDLSEARGTILFKTTSIKTVYKNGVTVAPSRSGWTSSRASAGITEDDFFCINDNAYMGCSNINGSLDTKGTSTTADDDNDSFGRFLWRAMPVGTVGYNSNARSPLGGLWQGAGDKVLRYFDPSSDPFSTTGDAVTGYNPPTGPVKTSVGVSKFYSKMDRWSKYCVYVYYSGKDNDDDGDADEQGVWLYNPPDEPDCSPEPEQVSAAPDTGPWGPAPDASLASLALRSDTLLADPLDDTPIQGPGIKPTDGCLTMTEASDPWTCNAHNWRSNYWKTDRPRTTQAALDKTFKLEGDGSLLFNQESGSGPGDGGKYEVNASKDGSIGCKLFEWCRLRYRIWINCDYLFLDCDPNSPGYKTERRYFPITPGEGQGGFKGGQLAEAHRPDGQGGSTFISNDALKTPVLSNYHQEGFFGLYTFSWNRIISKRYLINGTRYWDIQPGGPDICYSYDNWAGCHFLKADQWMTIQEDLYYGPCTSSTVSTLASRVRLWMADEGQPFNLAVDTPIDIGCGTLPEPGPKIGRMGYTTFMTDLEPSVHPDAKLWLDNAWMAKIDEEQP